MAILGVSFDGEAQNRAFAEKFSFPYLLLCDTGRDLGVAYGACDNKDGDCARRISYLIAPDGTIKHAWARVATKTHADDVLAEVG